MNSKRPAKPYHDRRTELQLELPLIVDFVPLLSFQTVLEGDRNDEQELYYFKGHVSERLDKVSPKGGAIESDLGQIKSANTSNETTVVEYGSPDPEDRSEAKFDTVPHDTIFEDVRDRVAVPEVVMKNRGIRHDVPHHVGDHPTLDGADALYQEQSSKGSMIHKLREVTQLNLANPHEIGKKVLNEYGLLSDTDAQKNFRKRARSMMVSDFVIPNNNRGYEDLLASETLFDVKRSLRAGRKWEDIGVPQEFTVPDGRTRQGRVYELDRTDQIVGLG